MSLLILRLWHYRTMFRILANSDNMSYERNIFKHESRSGIFAKRTANSQEHNIALSFLLSMVSLRIFSKRTSSNMHIYKISVTCKSCQISITSVTCCIFVPRKIFGFISNFEKHLSKIVSHYNNSLSFQLMCGSF